MSAAPWYLLAGGVGLVIIGGILLYLTAANPGRRGISFKMSDEEIVRRMQAGWGEIIGRLLVFLGGVVIFVSIVWRIVRIFVVRAG